MDGSELASEVLSAGSAGDHAKLHVLHRRIKHEGAQHIADRDWSRAKSALSTALGAVTTPDHKLLPKVAEIREGAANIAAYSELIRTGREPVKLHARRVTENMRQGKSNLSEGAPFTMPNVTGVPMNPNS
jgi:hypothetical protein